MSWLSRRSLVLNSFAPLIARAAGHPRYGGRLRVFETELPAIEGHPSIVETLVRYDEHGELQPGLARSWQRDGDGKRWRYWLRPRVLMHDGTPLTAPAAAALAGGRSIGNQLIIESSSPLPPMVPIFSKATDGAVIATGPFRAVRPDPGKRLLLTAFEEHWAGRPFLDAVEFSTQRNPEQEVVAIPISANRRSISERLRLWTSPVRDLIALVAPAQFRALLSPAIDREAIATVLTQRRGEPARGLLPEWLSGYAAALPLERDLDRARKLVQAAHPGPLSLATPSDPLLRLIADRIALNAREAGLTITPGSASPNGARLLRLTIRTSNAALELSNLARVLGIALPGNAETPQAMFDAENEIVSNSGVIPIVHIPRVFALDPRVHRWDPDRLENVWLEA